MESEDKEQLRVKRKTLEAVLEQCQRALELLRNDDYNLLATRGKDESDGGEDEEEGGGTSSDSGDKETDELCELLKSRVEGPGFLEKLENAQMSQMSASHAVNEEGSSWDMVSDNDLWVGSVDADQEDYVLVKQEDIVDGIACFMAAYLASLKQTKDLSPNQLQEALCKTFSVKKRKGKLRKAWDGGKVIYNVASWGATAIGIYQNPALLRAASAAFWTSCRVIQQLF